MSGDMKGDEVRAQSVGTQLGTNRYQRYCAAFDHLEQAYASGYPLEAIAILDSLIGNRMESRRRYLQPKAGTKPRGVGQLAKHLLGDDTKQAALETDAAFRAVLEKIRM